MNDKIYIATVGGQKLPVIQGLIEVDADNNFLLHSAQSKRDAETIKHCLALSHCELVAIDDPNKFFQIRELVAKITARQPEASFYVNISGGTKLMSLAVYSFFEQLQERSSVFHIDQNGMIHQLFSNKTEVLSNFLPIAKFIEFSGQRIKSFTPEIQIPVELYSLASEARNFYRLHYFKVQRLFTKYRTQQWKIQFSNSFELESDDRSSFMSWDPDRAELLVEFIHTRTGRSISTVFNGKEAPELVLNTKWLELEAIRILKKWSKTREIAWSLIIPYQEGLDKNEVDVVINSGTKLIFVECKTSVADIKDLDKFRNVTQLNGGLGAKSLLISWFYPKARVLEKCADNKIEVFSFLDPQNKPIPENTLFALLDRINQETNIK